MNPHYHHSPYPDLNSPHSPIMDGMSNNYHGHGGPQGGPPNGLLMNSHHEHLHSHPAFAGGQLSHHGNGPNSLQNYHHHHHHHLVNHNNHNNGNNIAINNQSHVTCAACGNAIRDRWIFKALNRPYHQNCIKCQCCQASLGDQRSFYTKDDNTILCRNDYLKMFGGTGQCCSCSESISANEMVMKVATPSVSNSPAHNSYHRVLVFHTKCFACSKCNSKLVAGDRYCVIGNSLICEQDWNKMNFKGSQMPTGQQQTTGTTIRKGKVGRPRRSRD